MEAVTRKLKTIAGSGGSSKSQGGSESRDTLKSTSLLSLVDLLGEGQIGGLVDNSPKSVFLDGTQLMSKNGTYNFKNVTWGFVSGTQTQDTLGAGFDTIESVVSVNKKVTNSSPFLFTIEDPNAEVGRLVMAVNALIHTDSQGNTNGSSVAFNVALSINGGAYVNVGDDTIEGKTRSHYQRSYSFNLPKTDASGKKANTWTFRVTRITDDSTDTSTSNDLYVDSWASAIETRLTYPNSALFGLSVSAEQFSSIPQRAYLVDGLLIKVPSNRNDDGTYTGVWDGTFKLASSDNPAWILYDIILSERYGLGQYFPAEYANPARLYEIGRYCDELVDDGFGGKERRFSINTVISSLADAYQIINDISSVFNGMAYWTGNLIGYMADMPGEVSMIYNSSNVINGEFNYQGVSRKERHSVALIRYNDPEREYEMQTEYIEDADLIARFGVRKAEVTAFGCTTRGQAHRVGRWLLYTEKYQKATISFNVGLDSAFVMPGDIIQIFDPARSGKRNGGRLNAISATSATLDSIVVVDANSTISIRLEDGSLVTRLIKTSTTVDGKTVVLWDEALTKMPVNKAVWSIISPDLKPQTARVIGVSQGENHGEFGITALEHNPSKFDYIESDIKLETPKITQINTTSIEPPKSVKITGEVSIDKQGITRYTMNISWEQVATAVGYTVKYRKANGNWIQMPMQTGLSVDIDNIYQGDYEAAVQAISPTNAKSALTYTPSTTVTGSASILPQIAIMKADGVENAINLSWNFADGTTGAMFTEIQRCLNNYVETPVWTSLTNVSYPTNTYVLNGLTAPNTQWFRARIIDSFGNASAWSDVVSAAPTIEIQTKIDEITAKADAAQKVIDDKLAEVDTQISDAKTNLNNEVAARVSASNDLAASVSNEAAARLSAVNSLQDQATQNAQAIKDEAIAREAAVTTKVDELSSQIQNQIQSLNDGITTEVQEIKSDNSSLLNNFNAYKASNDQAVAAVSSKAQSAVDASSSNASQINSINSTLKDKADASALQLLSSDVQNLNGTTNSQGSSITSLQNGIKAAQAASGDLIPNPTFDSIYDQMGYNVLSSAASEVPTGCPFPYVAKLASRDHSPKINNIPCKQGDVFEISALVACASGGTAAFNLYTYKTISPTSGGVGPAGTGGRVNPTTTWTRATWRWTIPAGVNYFRPFLQIEQNSPFGTVWYATDWHCLNVTAANVAQDKANANASAISELNTNVANIDGTLTSQAQSLDQLKSDLATVNTTANTATNSAATAQNTANTAVTSSNANASAITDLQGSIATINGTLETKANASALSDLSTRVTNAEGVNTSQGGAITDLKNSLTTTNATVATKADSSALGALNSRVTANEGNITSQANSLTNLTSRVSNTHNYTVKSRSNQSSGAAGVVDIDNSNTAYNTTRSWGITVFNADGSIKTHTAYDVFSSTTAAAAFNSAVAALAAGTYVAVTTFDEPYGNLGLIKNSLLSLGATTAAINQIAYRSAYLLVGKKGAVQGQSVELVTSDITQPIDYSLTMVKGIPNGVGGSGGLANAVTTLSNTASNIDGRVTTNASNITSLQNSVNTINGTLTTKADASALSALQNTVNAQGNKLDSNSDAITSLNNSVANVSSAVATKADSSAVYALSSRVSTAENNISTNTTDLTTLKGTVNNPTTGLAATASSLANLQNTVNSQGDSITSQASSITSLQSELADSTTVSPNLCPNTDFSRGNIGWEGMPTAVNTGINPSGWGNVMVGNNPPDGTHAIYSPFIPVNADAYYTLSGDSILMTTSGYCYFDMLFYDSAKNLVLDGDNGAVNGSHDFNNSAGRRQAHRTTMKAPSNVYYARVRFVFTVTSCSLYGFRLLKFEKGSNMTPYSNEAGNYQNTVDTAQAVNSLSTYIGNVDGRAIANSNAITSLTSTVNNKADASVLSNYYTQAQADSAIAASTTAISAKLITRPNLCPSLSTWTFGSAFGLDTFNDWGEKLTTSANGTSSASSPLIPVRPNGTYVLSYDTLRLATGGNVYADLQGYDAAGTQVWDGPQKARNDSHDFGISNASRDLNTIALFIPSNVVSVKVRFVCEAITGNTSCGIRQVKFEYGNLPATAYTMEAQLSSTSATIKDTTKVVNGISALRAVSIDNNGVLSGYALTSDLVNGKVNSNFGVNVDTFFVGNPANGQKMFVVSGGKAVMNSALIANLDAGAITTGTLNSGLIAANSITADKLSIGSLEALNVKIGKLTTASSGARLEITDTVIQVFDANNTVRVSIGLMV